MSEVIVMPKLGMTIIEEPLSSGIKKSETL